MINLIHARVRIDSTINSADIMKNFLLFHLDVRFNILREGKRHAQRYSDRMAMHLQA